MFQISIQAFLEQFRKENVTQNLDEFEDSRSVTHTVVLSLLENVKGDV